MRCFADVLATVERLLTEEARERVGVVLFDAFGRRLLERHAGHRFLRRLAVTELATQFPSTTTAHVTTMHNRASSTRRPSRRSTRSRPAWAPSRACCCWSPPTTGRSPSTRPASTTWTSCARASRAAASAPGGLGARRLPAHAPGAAADVAAGLAQCLGARAQVHQVVDQVHLGAGGSFGKAGSRLR